MIYGGYLQHFAFSWNSHIKNPNHIISVHITPTAGMHCSLGAGNLSAKWQGKFQKGKKNHTVQKENDPLTSSQRMT